MTLPSDDKPQPTLAQIEAFRKENIIPDDGKLEPWAVEENMVLTYLCGLAAARSARVATPEEIQAAQAVTRCYFEIAEEVVGADEVRRRFSARFGKELAALPAKRTNNEAPQQGTDRVKPAGHAAGTHPEARSAEVASPLSHVGQQENKAGAAPSDAGFKASGTSTSRGLPNEPAARPSIEQQTFPPECCGRPQQLCSNCPDRAVPSSTGAPEDRDAVLEWIECEEFYNLMQAYRHAPVAPQDHVLAAYREVKRFIADEILEDRKERASRSASGTKFVAVGYVNTLQGCTSTKYEAGRLPDGERMLYIVASPDGTKADS